ncbi:MAG: hypothetical protein K2J83_04085, partial [Clostridia bacterium]|nr:hypothetical protein [Clostridia bacterium]
MLFFCTAILCCAFIAPKTGNISAKAATVDINPSVVYDNSTTVSYNIPGGDTATTPTTVAYTNMTGSNNVNVAPNNGLINPVMRMNNNFSAIDADAGFTAFYMSVSVPAGAKLTVQYKFDMSLGKATDSVDGSSHYGAEFFHFGTGDDVTGENPVDITTLSFATTASSGGASVIRLDGGNPTSVFSCSLAFTSNQGNPAMHKGMAYYPNIGSAVNGCDPIHSGSYTTAEITYENTTNSNKVYKEYFGLFGMASTASGSCHIFWTELNLTVEKAEFEKVSKPSYGVDNYTYDGTDKTFTVTGIDAAKTALVKAEKTALDGTKTTLYEYTNYPQSPIASTGTNPLVGNQCKFTDAGIYTLSFRPVGAVWSDTLDTTAYEIKFYIFPKTVVKPTVATADLNGKTYNASSQTFSLTLAGGLSASTWSSYINIDSTKGGNLPTGVTDNSNGGFAVTDAGDYEVYLTLVDEKNTCWSATTTNPYTKTSWSGANAGGTCKVDLKMNAFELTVSKLDCDKKDGSNWAWNMGDTATVTLEISGFLLTEHATEGDADSVTLSYYYTLNGGAENPVSAKSETYDPASKTISATIELPTTLSPDTYTFGVKPDGSAGSGKNYTVKVSLATKTFIVSAEGLDPSVLAWTYTVDGVSDTTKRITDGGKLTYALKADGTATVYNPQIMLIFDTSDYTDKIEVDTSAGTGYTGSVSVSAVGANYATKVTLKVTDSNTKFVNPNNNPNITVSSDGKSATVTLKWEIEKADFDLSGIVWEYWYKDGDGNVHTDDYTKALEYNDNRWIYVRIKESSLPAGLSFNTNYTDVLSGYDTYGDRQKNINTTANPKYTTQFDAVNDFSYDTNSFNAPDATATTLKLVWEIAAKSIVAGFKNTAHTYSNSNGSGTYYLRELNLTAMGLPSTYASYFELKYYDEDGNEVTLAQIDASADPTEEKSYTVKAFISSTVAAAQNYRFVDASGNPVTPSATFKTGSSNTPATFTVDGQDGSSPIKVTYDGNAHFGTNIKVTDENGTEVSDGDFEIKYYTGKVPVAGNEISGPPTDAGEYCIEVVLKNGAENTYIVTNEYIPVTIEKIKIALPDIDEIFFNNNFVNLSDYMHGSWDDYKDTGIIVLGGTYDGVKFANSYKAILTITDSNYCWDYGTTATAVKKLAKYALAEGGINWTGNETVANLEWAINPYVLKASGWNLSGKEGAVYNIPANLLEGLDVELNYLYYTDKASNPLGDGDSLEAGLTYFVKAQLSGSGANNFVFEDSKDTTSNFATYNIPKNGLTAALGAVKDFMTGTLLGLPVWAWFLIGLALLILLIIIIVVACKRRKSKEEREEIKARKEEERQRREEERQMQREKLEAERELAKAKQEAELEKIRAQAGLAAGAGMAGVAMQQPQPQPQPVQQQMPIQQPQPQTVQYAPDNSVLAEIRA